MTSARPVPASRRSKASAAALLGALLALSLLFQGGCEGTSSGVDNPGLTVSFRDGQGNAARVTGTLEVYAADQNPAERPDPLKTVRVENSSFAILAGEDLGQLGGSGGALSKRAAGPAAFRFNVFFKGDARTGSLASGLAYDRDKAAFTGQGGGLERLEMRPGPLRRIRATLSRDAIHGDLGRIFIPGTGFQATVTGTGFELDGVPEGTYDLRLIGSDGRIFPILQRMDVASDGSGTRDFVFSASRDPVGETGPVDTAAIVAIEALGPVEAAVGLTAVLEARVTGVDSADRRLSVLWRQIPPGRPDTAVLSFPTRLSAQVQFRTEGLYTFEVSASLGGRTVRDTALVQVRPRPVPDSIYVLKPAPDDSVYAGRPFAITWDMPARARVSLSLSLDGFGWMPIVDTLAAAGLNTYDWTPSLVSDTAVQAYIRVHTLPPDSMSGQSSMFHLFPSRGPVDSLGLD